MNNYLIGIDVGTSGCKTVLAAAKGEIIAAAGKEYETFYGNTAEAEQDPASWWEAVCSTIGEVIRKSGVRPEEICAVGIDTQSSAFIPLDSDANLLHRALIWSDRRAYR